MWTAGTNYCRGIAPEGMGATMQVTRILAGRITLCPLRRQGDDDDDGDGDGVDGDDDGDDGDGDGDGDDDGDDGDDGDGDGDGDDDGDDDAVRLHSSMSCSSPLCA